MIQGKTVLAIIPARGGSKGIPRKNIKLLAGKPLIAWTIEEAKKSKYIDRLILSSEDEEIIKVAKEWSCEVPFVRPTALAKDDTAGIEPVLHAINVLNDKYFYVVVLQPTSPLRRSYDIDYCIEKCASEAAPACVSVTEVKQNPLWMYRISDEDVLTPIIDNADNIYRRQELPPIYILNGAVYIAESSYLQDKRSFLKPLPKAYIMPDIRSLDIDDEIDFHVCEILIKRNKND